MLATKERIVSLKISIITAVKAPSPVTSAHGSCLVKIPAIIIVPSM